MKLCAMLATVKTGLGHIRRWPEFSRRAARLTLKMQAGAKERLSNQTNELETPKRGMPPKTS